MKSILFFILCFYSFSSQAQNSIEPSLVLRSSINLSGVDPSKNTQHLIQQSTGQSSTIGSYKTGAYLLSQGFVQYDVWAKMVSFEDVLELTAKVFPNPFVSDIVIELLEPAESDVEVILFSPLGQELERYFFDENKVIQISLSHLPSANYFIKIAANNKQMIQPLIKVK